MESVGHDTKVDFRVNVMFCLCLWCPNGVVLTKTRIRYIKAAVFQMPYIQGGNLIQGVTLALDLGWVNLNVGCSAILPILFSHLCRNPICVSRNRQIVELLRSKSTYPRPTS